MGDSWQLGWHGPDLENREPAFPRQPDAAWSGARSPSTGEEPSQIILDIIAEWRRRAEKRTL
jgi:hypothetical protein